MSATAGASSRPPDLDAQPGAGERPEPFVLVVGCPRSGTYLLSLILGSEMDLAIPVETHFIPLFVPFLPLFGDLADARNRARLLDCIYDFLEIWTPRSERGRDPWTIRRHSLLATRPDAAELATGCASYPGVVAALFRAYVASHHMRGGGDKSAFFRHIPLDRIGAGVPDMKVVHVIRDGRDVSTSWLGIWTGPVNLAQAAVTWAEHVRAKRCWGREHPERYCEVRFEELLADPERVLEDLGRFVGRERKPGPLAFHASELAGALSGGAPHAKVSEPLDRSNCGKWRVTMSAADQEKFEYLAGHVLDDCGYERRFTDMGASRRLMLGLVTSFERLRARSSVHELQIQMKNLLPLVLWACRRLRVPLVRLLNRRYPEFADRAS